MTVLFLNSKGKNPAVPPDFFDQKVRSQASKSLPPGVKYRYAKKGSSGIPVGEKWHFPQ